MSKGKRRPALPVPEDWPERQCRVCSGRLETVAQYGKMIHPRCQRTLRAAVGMYPKEELGEDRYLRSEWLRCSKERWPWMGPEDWDLLVGFLKKKRNMRDMERYRDDVKSGTEKGNLGAVLGSLQRMGEDIMKTEAKIDKMGKTRKLKVSPMERLRSK